MRSSLKKSRKSNVEMKKGFLLVASAVLLALIALSIISSEKALENYVKIKEKALDEKLCDLMFVYLKGRIRSLEGRGLGLEKIMEMLLNSYLKVTIFNDGGLKLQVTIKVIDVETYTRDHGLLAKVLGIVETEHFKKRLMRELLITLD